MKIAAYLSLFVFLSSCGPKEQWTTYNDPVYPITIGYIPDPNKMNVDAFEDDGKGLPALEPFPHYRINVNTDFSEVHPDAETLETVYEVVAYKYEKDFQNAFRFAFKMPIKKETSLNGTPAILISDPENDHEEYILLVPGVYARVYLFGLTVSEKITRNTLKHFKWNQEIDTNSEEFKKWKKHIWGILKSGGKK